MGSTEEREKLREQVGRAINIIKYNPSVMKNPDAEIIYNVFKDEKNSENTGVFILKYTLDDDELKIPYQVILAKAKAIAGDERFSEKAKTIKELMMTQLRKNSEGKNDYDTINIIQNTCRSKNGIPLIFTKEGIEIMTDAIVDNNWRQKEDDQFLRTYSYENNILKCINKDRDMTLVKSEVALRDAIESNKRSNRMESAVEKELVDENDKRLFYKGRTIARISQENQPDLVMNKRKGIVKYLIDDFEKNKGQIEDNQFEQLSINEIIRIKQDIEKLEGLLQGQDPHKQDSDFNKKIRAYIEQKNEEIQRSIMGPQNDSTLTEKYMKLKEKGLAIAIKKVFENARNRHIR